MQFKYIFREVGDAPMQSPPTSLILSVDTQHAGVYVYTKVVVYESLHAPWLALIQSIPRDHNMYYNKGATEEGVSDSDHSLVLSRTLLGGRRRGMVYRREFQLTRLH